MTQIAHGFCDTCGAVGAVVVLGQAGQLTLAQCKPCDTYNFERAARRQIDAWLTTGRVNTAGF